jgi:hypothetical protein
MIRSLAHAILDIPKSGIAHVENGGIGDPRFPIRPETGLGSESRSRARGRRTRAGDFWSGRHRDSDSDRAKRGRRHFGFMVLVTWAACGDDAAFCGDRDCRWETWRHTSSRSTRSHGASESGRPGPARGPAGGLGTCLAGPGITILVT